MCAPHLPAGAAPPRQSRCHHSGSPPGRGLPGFLGLCLLPLADVRVAFSLWKQTQHTAGAAAHGRPLPAWGQLQAGAAAQLPGRGQQGHTLAPCRAARQCPAAPQHLGQTPASAGDAGTDSPRPTTGSGCGSRRPSTASAGRGEPLTPPSRSRWRLQSPEMPGAGLTGTRGSASAAGDHRGPHNSPTASLLTP